MFNVSILCKQSIRLFQQKLLYKLNSLHMHYLFINKELQRAITLMKLAPSPFFILIQMFILRISMCLQSLMKFHYCLFKIKKNQNAVDKGLQRAITQNWPLALIFYYKCSSCRYQCLQNLMKFHHCLFKLLRKKQTVEDYDLQRAITLKELAPSPYFSVLNVHLVVINVFAKCYEIPSLPFQDIEKSKCRRWTDGRTNPRMTI